MLVWQVGQLKGFSYTSKDRWVVIAPRFTPPPPGGSVGEVRVMMLLFRHAAEAEPRTKAWLDGATISMAGGEALLVSCVHQPVEACTGPHSTLCGNNRWTP